MEVNHIKFTDYREMLWKNGKGYTYELAKDIDYLYKWRVSQAEIKEDGLFSNFEGYQRIISVLDGKGIVLQVNDDEPVLLKAFDSFAFDGGANTYCSLVHNSVKDFNLIYDPTSYSSNFQWFDLAADKDSSIITSASIILIYAFDSDLNFFYNQESISIKKQDSLIFYLSDSELLNLKIASGIDAKYCILQLFKK